ncbi:MAG: hypothetical protein ACFFCH_06440 [Promethearchaeota archaeon]
MGTKDPRFRFLGAIVVASLGCLLIGFGLVYPIYGASDGQPQYAWGGVRYEHVRPIRGVVSNARPIVQVEFGVEWLSDVLVDVRNFYTNGTPVVLTVSSDGDQTTTWDFYNTTNEPINIGIAFDYSSLLVLTIQYDLNATFFSGWVLVQGILYPPMPPPPNLAFFSSNLLVLGIVLLLLGLYLFGSQKRHHLSGNWNQVLVFCTLGVLLLSVSYPSLASSSYRLYYHIPEYTDFGEFSGTLSASEPHVNMTLTGLSQCNVKLYGFHVATASVTIHLFSLDGIMNQTWNYVNSQYPGFRNFEIETPGNTVVEVIREAEDTAFWCWIITSHRPVEVVLNPAGAYAPFATLFLVVGVAIFSIGLFFLTKGFRDVPKDY